MFLLNCNTCDRGFHMKCLQPSPVDKSKSTWQCTFCLGPHDTTDYMVGEINEERRGRKKTIKHKRYVNK